MRQKGVSENTTLNPRPGYFNNRLETMREGSNLNFDLEKSGSGKA